jgi:hypothetical protein
MVEKYTYYFLIPYPSIALVLAAGGDIDHTFSGGKSPVTKAGPHESGPH